jgi:hypothetical protein
VMVECLLWSLKRLREAVAEPAGLVWGMLDVFTFRTLLLGPADGRQIAKHMQRTTEDGFQESTVRFTCVPSACAREGLSRNGRARQQAPARLPRPSSSR